MLHQNFKQINIKDFFVAANFPKTPSPKPARIPPQTPFCGREIQSRFCQIQIPRKIVLAKPSPHWSPTHCPETSWAEPRKKNTLSFSKRNFTPAKSEMQGVFFLSGLLAYSPVRGAFSERTIQFRFTTHAKRATSFVLEIGASLVQ